MQELNKEQIMNISGGSKELESICIVAALEEKERTGTLRAAVLRRTWERGWKSRAHSPTPGQIRVVHTPPNIKLQNRAAKMAARRQIAH